MKKNFGGVYFLFGADGKSVCYDNIKISQFDEIANAVPATDGQVYRDAGTYFNDFNSITTSALIQKPAGKAEVGADASDPERGNIIKILSGGSRLTVNDTNVFEAGHKYTISFDAKLDPDSATDTSRMYAIFAPINSLHSPRYFIMDTGSGCTNPDVLGAFKFYIDGQESTWKDFAIDKNWKTYTIEFDYTNESFLAAASPESTDDQMKGLSNAVSYFHFGCANGWFDNFKIVKRDIGEIKSNTQVSVRKESGSGENYVSAGLRFKNCLPNDVVAAADEIGFVVIPSSMAVTAPNSWYKLDGTGSANAKTVVCKKPGYNWIYEKTITDTYYQLVLTGLSTENGSTAYNRRFSAVMYVKNGDTYTYHALGETAYNQVGAIKNVVKTYNVETTTLSVSEMAGKDYKIVYEAESYRSWIVSNEIEKLQTALNDNGITVEDSEIYSDSTAKSDYEIVIGETNRKDPKYPDGISDIDEYAITCYSKRIYLHAGSTYALQAAIIELESMIKNGTVESVSGLYSEAVASYTGTDYKLVWGDEFDGQVLDETKWIVRDYPDYSDNKVDMIKDEDTFAMSDGNLIMKAIVQADGTYKLCDAIKSDTSFTFNKGYLEMRARVPDGKGVYSSFWTVGDGLEIDIFESLGMAHTQRANIHFWRSAENGGHTSLDGVVKGEDRQYVLGNGSLFDEYHTIGLYWDDTTVRVMYDGVVYYEQSTDNFGAQKDAFICIIAGFNVGWAGRTQPDENVKFPLEYHIDYIRLYQIEGQSIRLK